MRFSGSLSSQRASSGVRHVGSLSSLRSPEFVRLRLGRFSLARADTERALGSRESEDEADDSLGAELDDVEDTDDVEETDDADRDLERLRAIGAWPARSGS